MACRRTMPARRAALAALVVAAAPAVGAEAVASNATVGDIGTPFGALDCARARNVDGGWVFNQGGGTWHSCNMPIRGDHAYMCVNGAGQVDHTSIFVDMKGNPNKAGCFAWLTSGCTFDLRRVHQITFEVDVSNCASVWAAPLWLSPDPWQGPGSLSGEVDLLEFCPRGTIATNFGAAGGPGEHQQIWGSSSGLGGPKKYTMTLDRNTGTLTTQICHRDGTGCFNGGYYSNFLNVVHSTQGKAHSYPYHLAVDVWNGYGGDGGWYGCKAQHDPNTQCQFAVKNIKIHTYDGSPMWSSGKCAAMNGYKAVAEQPLPNETVVIV